MKVVVDWLDYMTAANVVQSIIIRFPIASTHNDKVVTWGGGGVWANIAKAKKMEASGAVRKQQ